jgi:ABC-2 type transport system ATP-binding protein
MTIFLTTQYLEEAEELAGRIGFINRGQVVAQGTPDELKRSVGRDVIFADLATDAPGVIKGNLDVALEELSRIPTIDSVATERGAIVLSTSDGPAALSPVAVALGNAKLEVRSLTLRRPTLDDVFRELTASALEGVATP